MAPLIPELGVKAAEAEDNKIDDALLALVTDLSEQHL